TRLVEGDELKHLDQLELAIVEDDPDDRDVVLNRGHQLEAGEIVAAVAAADDDSPLGIGAFGPQRAVHGPSHRAEAPRLAVALPLPQLQKIAEPGQVRAGIRQHDAVARQELRQRLRELTGVDMAAAQMED